MTDVAPEVADRVGAATGAAAMGTALTGVEAAPVPEALTPVMV